MLDKTDGNLELKIKELEEEKEHWENCLFNATGALLLFLVVAGFFFFKKPEYWLYPFWIFIGLSSFMFLLLLVSYKLYKKKEKRIKKIKRDYYGKW